MNVARNVVKEVQGAFRNGHGRLHDVRQFIKLARQSIDDSEVLDLTTGVGCDISSLAIAIEREFDQGRMSYQSAESLMMLVARIAKGLAEEPA